MIGSSSWISFTTTSWTGGFLTSNLFVALVTLVVGSSAIYLYYKKQRDDKRNAARTLLLEIQGAERFLRQLQSFMQSNSNSLPEKFYIMSTESWSKLKYLFAKDFDSNEWDVISDFYAKCKLCDDALAYNDSAFQKNEGQIRGILRQVMAGYAKDYIDAVVKVDEGTESDADKQAKRNKLWTKLQAQKAELNEGFVGFSLPYSPVQPITEVASCLQAMDLTISQGSVGTKLKKIAKIKP
jgi:hypothetical protein